MKTIQDRKIEFPCLNPNHNWEKDNELRKRVLVAWVSGEKFVRASCPECVAQGEPGFRDLFRPSAEVLILMSEAEARP